MFNPNCTQSNFYCFNQLNQEIQPEQPVCPLSTDEALHNMVTNLLNAPQNPMNMLLNSPYHEYFSQKLVRIEMEPVQDPLQPVYNPAPGAVVHP